MSLFITFEGGEGSGKSLQAKTLYKKLVQSGIPAVLTHEPGGTPLGEKISRMLKSARNTDISPMTELLLFNASRNHLVKNVIIPELKQGKVVVCDRFFDSTTVYQGYGRGLDMNTVKAINIIGSKGLKPALTILLDISPAEGLTRKKKRREHDRFEQEDTAFHQKIRDGYLKLAAEEPQRWMVIDASQSKTKIARIIWDKVQALLAKES